MSVSSSIIEDIKGIRESGLASLAFFYCDYREDQKKELRSLVSSFLVQLCHQSDSYFGIVFSFYLEYGRGSGQPNDDALIECLKKILKLRGQAPIYLIIDALDECSVTSSLPSPRNRIVMLVEQLVDSQIPYLHLCVTSRPEMDIKATLVPLTYYSISLHDEIGQIEDIENYIKSFVNDDTKMRRWNVANKELVIDALAKKADGM
jgi:hypothetical protein